MKIERPRYLQALLASSLKTGDADPLKAALAQAPPAALRSFLSSVEPAERRAMEKLLARDSITRPAPAVKTEPSVVRRAHDVRAQTQRAWWSGVKADPLPLPLHPEPPKDVDVHGERLSKDDVLSLLRSVSR